MFLNQKISPKLITKDIAMIAIFSALWTVLQIHFGPVVGRFSIGPLSLHGSVNRFIGWFLMTIMFELTSGFGKITLMTAIASFGTRIIRANPMEGFIVGLGYILGGLLFDFLVNNKPKKTIGYIILISAFSAILASGPYLLSKIYFLGLAGFIMISPLYLFSTVKGLFFSLLGTSLGIKVIRQLQKSRALKYAAKDTISPNLSNYVPT